MKILSRIALLAVLAGLVCACDPGVEVLNVAPTVTAVGPVSYVDGHLEIVIWVRDHEEQAVDVTLQVLRGGQAVSGAALSGGHGVVGLTTNNSDSGEPHLVHWGADGGGIAIGDKLQVRVTATDRSDEASLPVTSAEFVVSEGLAAP